MRRLGLLAALVTALGPAGLGCAQAPLAEEAASETVALAAGPARTQILPQG